MFDTLKERRLIKVALIIVAVIVGIVVIWWAAATVKAQQDAKAKIEAAVKPRTTYVNLDALGVRYKSSETAGQVSYDVTNRGGVPTVPLISSRLKLAKYTCSGTTSGEFGYLLEMVPAAFAVQPTYKKEINSKTYAFVSTIRKECFSADLAKQFGETVPKAIMDSLEPIPQ